MYALHETCFMKFKWKRYSYGANLKKAPKLTYTATHPRNNKQNVSLVLAVFDETISS